MKFAAQLPASFDSHPLVPESSNGLQLPPGAVLWCPAWMAHRDPGTHPSGFRGCWLLTTPTESFSGNCVDVASSPSPWGQWTSRDRVLRRNKTEPPLIHSIQDNSAGPRPPWGWAEASTAATSQPTFSCEPCPPSITGVVPESTLPNTSCYLRNSTEDAVQKHLLPTSAAELHLPSGPSPVRPK